MKKLNQGQVDKLVELASGPPPEGVKNWSLQLLASKMIELGGAPNLTWNNVKYYLDKRRFDRSSWYGRPLLRKSIVLSSMERRKIIDLIRDCKLDHRRMLYANILLAIDDGARYLRKDTDKSIARSLGTSLTLIKRIRSLFIESGIDGVLKNYHKHDTAVRRKYKARITSHAQELQLISLARGPQPDGYARWTVLLLRREAARLGIFDLEISVSLINRILKRHNFDLKAKWGSSYSKLRALKRSANVLEGMWNILPPEKWNCTSITNGEGSGAYFLMTPKESNLKASDSNLAMDKAVGELEIAPEIAPEMEKEFERSTKIFHEGEECFPAKVCSRIIRGDSPIRVFREYRGLSEGELALKIDVAPEVISQIESGEYIGPMNSTFCLLKKIAAALNVEVEDLLP